MASTSISIARLRQLGVPVAWQEAVEVARLAGQAAEQHQAAITLEGCHIDAAGSVALTAGHGAAGALSVMQLLAALLDGQTAPPELVTLVMRGDEAPSGFTTPAQDRPKALSLDWFFQPNPEIEVARLAARALAADAAAVAAASIAQLRAQVSEHHAPTAAAPPPVPRQPLKPWQRRTLAAAAVTIAAGAVLVAWSRWGGEIAATVGSWDVLLPAPAADPAADAPAASGSGKAATRATRAASNERSPRPVPASPTAAGLAGPRAAVEPGAAGLETDTPADAAPRIVPSSPAAEGHAAGATFWLAPGDGGETGVAIYTEQDAGVMPPKMTFPKLPSAARPDSPPSDSYIDVLVDEHGQVQQVRLHSTEASVNDGMILAAAKAWQFEPARKDGVPVMFVLRVPVTR